MSGYWNNRTKNLSPYVPGEQPRDRQFIKLNTNENPYPPSPAVIEAIQKAADDKLRLYPDPECTQFREAVAERYGVEPGQVFAGNGSDEILSFAFGAFFEKTILFPDITYSFYPVFAGLWDIPFNTVPLCEDFSININDFKIPSGGTVISNPNAPTGIALPLDDILSLAEYSGGACGAQLKQCAQKNVLIVDEAYTAFGAGSASAYIGKYPNMLIVNTLSKSASLAGLRAGFAIGGRELIEGLRRIRDSFNSYTLDRLALCGAAAAVKDEKYYDEINRKVMATRERVSVSLRSLGFLVLPSCANFIFIKNAKIKGAQLSEALRKQGILVRHFQRDRIEDFIRVSMGTDEQMNIFINSCKNILGVNDEDYQK